MMAGKALVFRFDDVEVREREFSLVKAGKVLTVEPKAFRALLFLLHNPQRLISKEELLNSVWGDAAVTEGSLTRCIWLLRSLLGDDIRSPRYIETVATVGYRLICKVEVSDDASGGLEVAGKPRGSGGGDSGETQAKEGLADAAIPKNDLPVRRGGVRGIVTVSVVLVLMAIGAGSYFYFHRTPRLTDKDTIVLADFDNRTGDPVFDGTLRQGLSVQLEQSPFLRIIADQQVQQTLQMMGQKADTKLTPEIARELCRRADSAAVLNGSIAQIGTQYLLTLKAVNCASGESLASTEAEASDKNHVLDALGKTASEIRSKLGESLSTVTKLDTPLEQATTPSVEALQAYSLGREKLQRNRDYLAAAALFQRAIRLDPNFAMAHLSLGLCQLFLGETSSGSESIQKAYSLSERVSQWEKFAIESRYFYAFTGDLEKGRQTYELWAQAYPRDRIPVDNLSGICTALGQYDRALATERDASRLQPSDIHNILVASYLNLNRLDEALATAEEAQSKRLDSPLIRLSLYKLAFLRSDAAGMEQQVAWAKGKPGAEDMFLDSEAQTAAYSGRLAKAREFSRQATASALGTKQKETAAGYEAEAALREALFGNAAEARQRAAAALGLSTGRDVQYLAALSLALARDASRADALAAGLAARYPEGTIIQFNYLPTLHAQIALSRRNAPKAIEALLAAAPYELGTEGNGLNGGVYMPALHPVYVRGEAYLAAHRGGEASAEFQKILDHRGVVVSQAIGALARLQIGRAYAMQGDAAKAKAAYQDFLALWKDADPGIPILKEAKAEYAKLQ